MKNKYMSLNIKINGQAYIVLIVWLIWLVIATGWVNKMNRKEAKFIIGIGKDAVEEFQRLQQIKSYYPILG